jgi:hypothetical protein
VTTAEGVPVNVNAEVVPLQIGDTGETVAVRLDVTVMTILSGVVHPFNEICVSVMVTPEGQLAPSTKLTGLKKFVPPGAVVITPLPPEEVVQLSDAPGVAVTENASDVPAQSELVFVEAVGRTCTFTVEFIAGPVHPFKVGVTEYCTEPAVVPVAVRVCAIVAPDPLEAPEALVAV